MLHPIQNYQRYYKNIKDVQVHFMPENLVTKVLFRSINKDFYEKLPNFLF